MPKPRPRKLLMYLDQNFVSEMAKVGMNLRVRDDFRQLFELLHKGFWDEKLVVLRSAFHEEETSMAGALRDPIRGRQSMLGHVHLVPYDTVKRSQIERAFAKYIGRGADILVHEDIFHDDPDDRVGHLDIDVDMDGRFSNSKHRRSSLADELDKVRIRLRDNATSFEAQYAIEMNSERRMMLERPNSARHRALISASAEEWHDFVMSTDFGAIPVLDLEVGLLAKTMTAHAHRKIKDGDVTDIDAMATYLPYCDMYATDSFIANIARSLNVPGKYGGELYCADVHDVSALLASMERRLESMAPANQPALTLFVKSDAIIKRNSFEFFRTIGLLAKSSESVGSWIEVYGFDDGAMPKYASKDSPGNVAPYYGLQEVMSLASAQDWSDADYVEACRKNCRSPEFVLVDRYQVIPDDFIARAILTAKLGAADVIGYSVHRCAR